MGILHRLSAWIGVRSGGTPRPREESPVDYARLQAVLQYSISHRPFFNEALTHRSYLQNPGNAADVSNERLEFLGDAVLNLIVGEYLFRTHSHAPEGELTKLRARLVNKKALGIMANLLRLGEFILLSPAAAQLSIKGMDTILSDTFEAIVGAMYLDGGYSKTKDFVNRCIDEALSGNLINIDDDNFKSQLLEHVQSLGLGTPRYLTTRQDGPDHDRTFTIEVSIGNRAFGIGTGKNKKDAEQAAAEQTLAILRAEHPGEEPDGLTSTQPAENR